MNNRKQQNKPLQSAACLHERFEAQVARHPDKVAVVFENQSLTYRQLNDAANRLAQNLLGLEVQKEDIVAFHLNKSAMIPAAMLGILKAGAAFLPLDPQLSQQRLQKYLRASKAKILLTEKFLHPFWEPSSITKLVLDDPNALAEKNGRNNPGLSIDHRQLAYLLFKNDDKGVLVEHFGAVNAIEGQIAAMNLSHDEKILQFSSISSDTFIAEILMGLLGSGTVFIIPPVMENNAAAMADFVRKNWITLAILTPSRLKSMDPEVLSSVRNILSIGEICPPFVAERWRKGRRFYNGFGTPEVPIFTSVQEILEITGTTLPVGRSIGAVSALVLDGKQKLVRPGEIGELYIGGPGLSRGYFDDPQLTKKRFVTVQMRPGQRDRLFRTGVLVRQSENGVLTLCGQKEHRVKVGEELIFLSEVENAMTAIGGVLDCVVVPFVDSRGSNRLAAYWLPAGDMELSDTEFRECLEMMIPETLIPSRFVKMESFPLTPTGVLDRQALPGAYGTASKPIRRKKRRRKSSDQTSVRLKELVVSVLGLEQIDENQNFFQLGGNSLDITQLACRISTEFGVRCSLSSLLQKPTVAQLSTMIRDQKKSPDESEPSTPENRSVPQVYDYQDDSGDWQ